LNIFSGRKRIIKEEEKSNQMEEGKSSPPFGVFIW
jgi:hypothetical protein